MKSPSKHLPVKDQIWWHGVNISEKLQKIASENPVEPLRRRQPEWQSVSSFFMRASHDLAAELPIRNAGRCEARVSPGSRGSLRSSLRSPCRTRLSVPRASTKSLGHGSSPISKGARPKTAAASRRHNAGLYKDAPVIRRRPQSAPALLRNDEPGLIAKKTHKDPLRQHLEDFAVLERMEWLKREGQTKRELIAKVDVLADPILFDLKVLHNSAARAKTAPVQPPSPSKSKAAKGQQAAQVSQAEGLRGLSRTLAKDTRRHCARLHIPYRVVEGEKMRKLFEKLMEIKEMTSAHLDDEPKPTEFKAEGHVDPAGKVKPDIGGAFAEQLKGLWGNATGVCPGDLSHPLVRLAYFLNGHHCPKRMRMVLEAFDCACKGSINLEDFCTGLELMSYQSVSEYKDLFLMLDSEGRKELQIDWLEAHLKSLVHEDDEPG